MTTNASGDDRKENFSLQLVRIDTGVAFGGILIEVFKIANIVYLPLGFGGFYLLLNFQCF